MDGRRILGEEEILGGEGRWARVLGVAEADIGEATLGPRPRYRGVDVVGVVEATGVTGVTEVIVETEETEAIEGYRRHDATAHRDEEAGAVEVATIGGPTLVRGALREDAAPVMTEQRSLSPTSVCFVACCLQIQLSRALFCNAERRLPSYCATTTNTEDVA